MNGVLVDIQENIWIVLGSIASALGIILGLIFQSGVLNTLVGVAIGAGITYYVQTKTQNRAWKREYSVKIAEVVYGNLFKEIKSLIQKLGEKYCIYWISFGTWKEFQQDHRYFMVEKGLRDKLDLFTGQLDDYSNAAVKLGSEIRNIIFEETERVYGVKTNQIPRTEVTFMQRYTRCSYTPDLVQCVLSETSPIDFVSKRETEISNLEMILTIASLDGRQTHVPYSSDFNEFWQSCLRKMRENGSYKAVTNENIKIGQEALKLQDELIERIEKPWKI